MNEYAFDRRISRRRRMAPGRDHFKVFKQMIAINMSELSNDVGRELVHHLWADDRETSIR
jgi:hypothetical protein